MNTLTVDAQLVTAYLAGDQNALASIYDLYASGLYDTAAAMLSDRHDAADMVQDVFCIAAERLNQLRDPNRLKPWLYAVLRNEVYRRTKKRKRATPTDFQSATVPDVIAPFDPNAEGATASFDELAELVRSAAAGLDERDRLVLELSVRQGLTGTDLADALGVSPEQSYSLVHRMRDRVEKSLGAFTVAKMGRNDCKELASIISGWNGEFSVLIRKRVARHIDECAICEKTRSKFAPLALFGAAPVFLLPVGLRDKVLAATQTIPLPSQSADVHGLKTQRGSHRSRHIKLSRNDGFPRLARASRHAMAFVLSTGAALLLIAGVVLVQQDDGSNNEVLDEQIVVDSTQVAIASTVLSAPEGSMATNSEAPTTSVQNSEPTTNVIAPIPSTRPTTPAATSPVVTTPTATTPVVTTPTATTPVVTTSPAASITPTTTPQSVRSVSISTTNLDFARRVTASLTLTNNNEGPVNWLLKETSGYFTFVPSSGSLAAGATQTVSVTFARTAASGLDEGGFSFPATASTSGASDSALTLSGIVGRPPIIANFTPTFAEIACSVLNIQVPITDESPIASVKAKITYFNSQNLQSSPPFPRPLNDSGKGSWVTSWSYVPATTTRVIVKVTATDSYGFWATYESEANRTNGC
ncbi:MAG: sigma-70 family RNA polymerase sigma factor [Actinomycetota bacterium]|nr:sigma-70 family RNA polymerase sigma factor [Actinomycetota bacterium]